MESQARASEAGHPAARDGARDSATGPLSHGPLTAIRRTSALDTVRARISLAVDLGLLAPGEKLPNVRATASALGVGEITVRRAFSALEREGIVRRRPGRNGGTFIAEQPRLHAVAESDAYRQDAARVRRLIDERVVMEAGLAHLATERMDAATLELLDAAIAEMDAATTWADFHAGDKRFHATLASAAGLPGAVAMYTQVTRELYCYFLPYSMSYLRTSNEQHKQIKAACADGDATRAARLLSAHAAELHQTMYVGLTGQDAAGSP